MEKVILKQVKPSYVASAEHEDILRYMLVSFKMEGIHIPYDTAKDIMHRVNSKLKK